MNVLISTFNIGLICLIVFFNLLFFNKNAMAQSNDIPIGLWKTIDDETGQAKSYVKIWEYRGMLYGKITKLINPETPNPVCSKCEGRKHDQPIEGLQIIWGLQKNDANWWEGGKILDPESGKIYRCKIRSVDGGKQLEVRGFIGVSLLGRTQTWYRSN